MGKLCLFVTFYSKSLGFTECFNTTLKETLLYYCYLATMQLAIIPVGYKCENLNGSEPNIEKMYPTGQNYSLVLMFTKFATAKYREELNPQTFSSSDATCLNTTLEKDVKVKRVHSNCESELRPPDYKACYKFDALSLSYRAS